MSRRAHDGLGCRYCCPRPAGSRRSIAARAVPIAIDRSDVRKRRSRRRVRMARLPALAPGSTCALVKPDVVYSAAAPTPRCKNPRRGIFMAFPLSPIETMARAVPSLRLDVGRSDDLGPLVGERSNEVAEIGGRACKYRIAQIGKSRF